MDKSVRKAYLIFLSFFIQLYAGNDEELFLRGNKLYEQSEYEQALIAYDAITHKGRAVLHNMGNCYFHKNDFAHAFVCWGRAERGATQQEMCHIAECRHNGFERLKKQSVVNEKCRYGIENMMPCFSLFVMQVIFLFAWYMCVFFVCNYGRIQKIRALIFCLCISTLSGILYIRYKKHSACIGVVMHNRTPVFVGPHASFYCKDTIGIGYVEVLEKREGWYKVRYFDTIGWMKADVIQLI